jgi:hypothetical protein
MAPPYRDGARRSDTVESIEGAKMLAVPRQRQQWISSLRELPTSLEAVVGKLPGEQLDAPGGEGEWSIRQVVHHVADANLNFFARTKWVLTEERPALKLLEQEDWARLPDATEAPLQASLLLLRGLHQRWVLLLESLAEADWERTALHPTLGELTLADLIASYSRHGEIHLEQIAQIRAANDRPAPGPGRPRRSSASPGARSISRYSLP